MRFLFGICIGIFILIPLAAFDLLYLLTGKLLVPGKGGLTLITLDRAVDQLDGLIGKLTEAGHG